MDKLWSRKEVCKELNISMRTLCRKIEELNIECVNELLGNGVVSKKISHSDFMKISSTLNKGQVEAPAYTANTQNQDLLVYGLKTELVKAQLTLESTIKELANKNKLLEEKNETIKKLEEKNDRLFEQLGNENERFIQSLSRINELQNQLLQAQAEQANKKGFFARLFGK